MFRPATTEASRRVWHGVQGDKALGYIVFEVPTTSKVSMVQFGTDSGFGGTGEWQVG